MGGSAPGSGKPDTQGHAGPARRSPAGERLRFSPPKKEPLPHPHPHRHEKYALPAIEAALRKHKGMIARAARALRCTPQTIRNYLKRHPTLAAVVAEERELIVDVAELKLHEAVRRGEPWAVCFTLKCLGKDRGYLERQERTTPAGQPPGPSGASVVVLAGDTAEYVARLRALREASRPPELARPPALPLPPHGEEGGSGGSVE